MKTKEGEHGKKGRNVETKEKRWKQHLANKESEKGPTVQFVRTQ